MQQDTKNIAQAGHDDATHDVATHAPPLHTSPALVQSVQGPPPVPQAALAFALTQLVKVAPEAQHVLQLLGPQGPDPLPPLEDVDEDVLPPLVAPLLPPPPLLLVPLPPDELDDDPLEPVPDPLLLLVLPIPPPLEDDPEAEPPSMPALVEASGLTTISTTLPPQPSQPRTAQTRTR